MITESFIGRYLFNPIAPIMLYLFMAITTLHMQIPFLLKIHIEAIVLTASVLNTIIFIFFKDNSKSSSIHPLTLPILLGLLFIISPLITSLFNQDQLAILQDNEYKDLFKMTLFSFCLYFFLNKEKYKNFLLNSIIIFYFIFSIYFLYRFLILHEVRDFDQRPLLKIRHGDPNFLCTFFSMMIPLPLMQAWNARNKKQFWITIFFLFAGSFFFTCAFLTESRMGLISVALSMIYLLARSFLSFSKSFLMAILLLISIIFLSFNGERIFQRYADIQDKSNTDRYLTWKNGFQVFKENPIIGVGMHKAVDSFYQNTRYPPFQSEFLPLDVHNTFLKVAAELGIIGLFFFMLIFLWPWKKSFQMLSNNKFFLISSMGILTLSIMTIGIVYKDLFILHLFIIAALASSPIYKSRNN